MDLKELDEKYIEEVYYKHMKTDFPPEELKPIEAIKKLIKRSIYKCYGLYDNEELLAYAFLVTSRKYLLIDYYSVCEKYRNRGIGSELFNILRENNNNYNGIIVECESVESAPNETEKLIRQRRIDFYKRNGMKMTNILSILFNVKYSIMCCCNIELQDKSIYEGLIDIYKEITPSSFYSKYVEVYIQETNLYT